MGQSFSQGLGVHWVAAIQAMLKAKVTGLPAVDSGGSWWARWGSNPRPSGYEPHALTPELQAPLGLMIPSARHGLSDQCRSWWEESGGQTNSRPPPPRSRENKGQGTAQWNLADSG